MIIYDMISFEIIYAGFAELLTVKFQSEKNDMN